MNSLVISGDAVVHWATVICFVLFCFYYWIWSFCLQLGYWKNCL